VISLLKQLELPTLIGVRALRPEGVVRLRLRPFDGGTIATQRTQTQYSRPQKCIAQSRETSLCQGGWAAPTQPPCSGPFYATEANERSARTIGCRVDDVRLDWQSNVGP